MDDAIYLKRQDRLREILNLKGLDGILISNLTNIRYISGFTGSAASCLITPLGQYFITDGRYIEQSKAQVKGFEIFIDMNSHLNQIKKNDLISKNLKLAFESDHVSHTFFNNIMETFPKTEWEISSMNMYPPTFISS